MDRIRRIWKDRFSRGSYLYVACIVFLIILLFIVIFVVTMLLSSETLEQYRIECPGINEQNCTKLLCAYSKMNRGPSCFMRKDSFGYVVQSVDHSENSSFTLHLKGISRKTPYGRSIDTVTFKLTYLTENILRFQFKDAANERYEVPAQKDFPLLKENPRVDTSKLSYTIVHSNVSETFFFGVKRENESTYIWDTSIGGLLLSDQYLQIASYLPSKNVYGLGEHVHHSLKHTMDHVSWPMFARDRPSTAKSSGNLYGVHPFYTCLEKSGKSHGVFFLNSNAMEVTLMPSPAISFRTIGGILDFFIFVGDSPEHVTQLYTSLIGRTMMPPYWSLGFQLSRYGYNNLSKVEAAINRTRAAKIPQAVQYLDIDHMDRNMDFTSNKENFPDLPEFINYTKKNYGLKWIIILDPAIAAVDNYLAYGKGLHMSVFVKRPAKWKPSMYPPRLAEVNVTFGKVWPPDYVAFPDFFLNKTKQWWKDFIIEYRDNISFDALWIDMNEPANFGTNEEYPEYCETSGLPKNECWALKCPKSIYEDPPYNPLLATGSGRLSEKTLCMESVQGEDKSPFMHYDVHSLYGWSQTQPTLQAAQQATGTRSLVISRSTYPSSGRYAGHWLGDNDSTWEDMKLSIIGMLEFNIFGIPYVGADVCGFFGNTTEELCKRWMQLGAFYPFYRNHNNLNEMDQDPAALGEDVSEASRKAVVRRLNLNPYLYTLFYRAHVDGNTVVRPLFHEYPLDPETWDMATQFMWGKSLLITPILEKGKVNVEKYLPFDEWWLFKNEQSEQQLVLGNSTVKEANEYTPVHVRGGVVLPCGNYTPESKYPENYTPHIVLYVFPKEDKAKGELFVDDGLSIDTIEKGEFALYQFTYKNCTLKIKKQKTEFNGTTPVLDSVVVFKVKEIAKAYSGKRQYNFTEDKEYHTAAITIKKGMDNVGEIKWEASDKSCQMLTSIPHRATLR